MKSRAKFLGIELVEGDEHTFDFEKDGKQFSGVLC